MAARNHGGSPSGALRLGISGRPSAPIAREQRDGELADAAAQLTYHIEPELGISSLVRGSAVPVRDAISADGNRDQRNCNCEAGYPKSPMWNGQRVIACAHFDGQTINLFRHFDLPHVWCISKDGEPNECFYDAVAAILAFEAAERELLGRSDA